MITERALLPNLEVEAYIGSTWTPLLADATTMTIRRGGVRDGLGIKTDVGLCTFKLLDTDEPEDLAVGLPVRVLVGAQPVYHPATVIYSNDGTVATGWVTTYNANGSGASAGGVTVNTGRLYLYTTGGTTNVNPTPYVYATRTLTGLVPGLTYSFSALVSTVSPAQRAYISLGSGVSSFVASTTASSVSGSFVATGTSATLRIEVQDNPSVSTANSNAGGYFDNITVTREPYTVDNREAIFTGRIAWTNEVPRLNKQTNVTRTYTEVTVADAVQIHMSTMRYGRDLGVETNETFEERIDALESSSNAPVDVPVVGAPLEVYAL